MEYIGNKSTIEYLKLNREIEYIAYVITPWHALAFLAALKKIENTEKRKLTGIVIIKEHVVNGFCIDDDNFKSIHAQVYKFKDDEFLIDRVKSEFKGIRYYGTLNKCNNDLFYLFRPIGFRYAILAGIDEGLNHSKNISVVTLDEGVGSYLWDNGGGLRQTLKENRGIKKKAIAIVRYLEGKVFSEEKLRYYGRIIDGRLFIKEANGKCKKNSDMACFFENAIEEYIGTTNLHVDIANEPYVIINTQPLTGYTITNSDIQIEILKQIIPIVKKQGYRVVIKPHPREDDYVKYRITGAEVLRDINISQEALLASLKCKPSFIIGNFSTTLITCKAIFNIPTISISRILIKTNQINALGIDVMSEFLNMFSEFVMDCDSLERLSDLL